MPSRGDDMSLDKAIEHKKERRKPYRGAKAIDCTCRNHGSCDYCKYSRLHNNMVRQNVMDSKLDEYEKGEMEDEVTDCN